MNEASLLRLVSAMEIEVNGDWIAGKRYMNVRRENESESANSNEKIYRKKVT